MISADPKTRSRPPPYSRRARARVYVVAKRDTHDERALLLRSLRSHGSGNCVIFHASRQTRTMWNVCMYFKHTLRTFAHKRNHHIQHIKLYIRIRPIVYYMLAPKCDSPQFNDLCAWCVVLSGAHCTMRSARGVRRFRCVCVCISIVCLCVYIFLRTIYT